MNIREALAEVVDKSLRRAFSLGQTYWQQVDSESWTQQQKGDQTAAKFNELVAETRAALAAQPAQAQPLDRDFILGLAAGEFDCVDEEYIVRFARLVERAVRGQG